MATNSKEYMRAWRESHREEVKTYNKAWRESHKEEQKEYFKVYHQDHREEYKEYFKVYHKEDVNSSGKPKGYIRTQSQRYLHRHGTKIPGYEIHHCFTYNEPYKFIYCSHETHQLIHAYLKEHNIAADSEHYEQIKHLLDDTVVLYPIKEETDEN